MTNDPTPNVANAFGERVPPDSLYEAIKIWKALATRAPEAFFPNRKIEDASAYSLLARETDARL
jgi:hypothetical protein